MEIRRRGSKFVSSDGWTVETRGRGAMIYREGLVAASVGAEMLAAGSIAFVVYPEHIRPLWYSLKRRFSADDRARIGLRIREAFQATGNDVEIAG